MLADIGYSGWTEDEEPSKGLRADGPRECAPCRPQLELRVEACQSTVFADVFATDI